MLSKPPVIASILLAAVGKASVLVPPQNQPDASPNEYKVFESVLGLMDHIPKADPRINIYDVTLNSKCGDDADPAPLANGCTFLWIKPDNAQGVNELLRQDWKDMDDSTWLDFVATNSASVGLHEPIATPWKHNLVGPRAESSKDADSPDLTIFLSRVGFNPKKTEAIVYVLTISYMNQVKTAGDYFLFRTDKSGSWKVKGRVTYFSKDKDDASQ
ncbi:MAG: hypothetical protein WA823_08730 [Candidatus Acidiferrales bacterium]